MKDKKAKRGVIAKRYIKKDEGEKKRADQA